MEFEALSQSLGEIEAHKDVLKAATIIVQLAQAQKGVMVIIGLVKGKPSKPEKKQEKANNLKEEMKLLRKHGLKEEEVLGKSLHESAIKQISTLS